MIRVVFFLLAVGALALAAAWLADRPGDVVLTWQGLRIETSLMVLIGAMLAAMAVLALIWSLAARGFHFAIYLARGICTVAVASAPMRRFRAVSSQSAPAILPRRANTPPKQSVSRRPNRSRCCSARNRRNLPAIVKRLKLLFAPWRAAPTPSRSASTVSSSRRSAAPITSARHALAEEAARDNPSLGWAGKAVLEMRCATGDWAGALALLEGNKRALDKESYRRQRAVMLTARALATEETDRDNAKAFALEAAKLAPTLVPAAALAGRMLAEGGELRKATRVCWKKPGGPIRIPISPRSFPNYGSATPRATVSSVSKGLVKKMPGHIEGALAMARAAIDAQEFGKARAALAAYLEAPTKRIALLMAELERAEHNDEGRAREWIARALNAPPDPAWTADGHVSDRWLPVSPSGRLDAFEWRVPVTGMVTTAPVIEPDTSAAAPAPAVSELGAESAPRFGRNGNIRRTVGARSCHARCLARCISPAQTGAGHPACSCAGRSRSRCRRRNRAPAGAAARRLAKDVRISRNAARRLICQLANHAARMHYSA